MLVTQQIDTQDKRQGRRFLDLPYRLYKNHPQWVPPLRIDVALMLNQAKHPFYEHSEADFFTVERDGQVIGRIAMLENKPYNVYHAVRQAQFYLFECEDDTEAAAALFARAFEWVRARGLTALVGPKGFGPLDGYGVLVKGFEHRQMMTMMNYHYPYYARMLESQGFEKEVDFVSCYLNIDTFKLPERIHRIAERVKQRGSLEVMPFKNKAHIRRWVRRIGQAYNQAFVNNWEYYPLTENEINFVVQNIITLADARLIKVILHKDEIVGFLFAFPDVSAALQRTQGRLTPWALADLLLDMRRTRWVAINGGGILPAHQGIGGNALLYAEMENTLCSSHFIHADLTQIAETAVQMRHDLETIGGKMYKNHRVYIKHNL
ncbi:MAG: hypothetical protein JXA33_15685 [Anaerolineae bacterium]|nr:hypothetical protein [Anaerolineae bacterium]